MSDKGEMPHGYETFVVRLDVTVHVATSGTSSDAAETATEVIGQCLRDEFGASVKVMEVCGSTSDGYHTFDELYDHRAKLFSVIVHDHREWCWKSMHHHDGTMYDGMFVVGIDTPDGQASYHYDVDPYWTIFDCRILDRAPEWDGHTPAQAIGRIARLALSGSDAR